MGLAKSMLDFQGASSFHGRLAIEFTAATLHLLGFDELSHVGGGALVM